MRNSACRFSDLFEQSIEDILSDAEYEMYIDKITLKKQPGYRERLTKGQPKI